MKCPYSSLPQWDKCHGTELYNHTGDPSNSFGVYENINLAYEPSHKDLVKSLRFALSLDSLLIHYSEELQAEWPKVPPV